jgi:hypothetical protein
VVAAEIAPDAAADGRPSCSRATPADPPAHPFPGDDPAMREALVDAVVRDCRSPLVSCTGAELPGSVDPAAKLLALVVGRASSKAAMAPFDRPKVARDQMIRFSRFGRRVSGLQAGPKPSAC